MAMRTVRPWSWAAAGAAKAASSPPSAKEVLKRRVRPFEEPLGVLAVDRHHQLRQQVVECLRPGDDPRLVVDDLKRLSEPSKGSPDCAYIEAGLIDGNVVQFLDCPSFGLKSRDELRKRAQS